MSILNVDKIQPIGGGSTITVDATDIQASTGTIRASTFSGDVSATGIGVTSLNITGVTTSAGIVQAAQFKLLDNAKAKYGTGEDLEIYHNATNSLIQNGTGSLQIVTTTGGLFLRGQDNITFNTAGNNERLRISSGGNLHAAGITTSNTGFMFGTDGQHYLYQSASDTATLRITSDGPYVQFKDASGDVQMGSASGTLRLSAGGAEKLRVNTQGNFTFYNSAAAWNTIQRATATHYNGIRIQETDGTQRMQFGVAGGANQIVTGAAQHDVCLKAYDANLILATNATERLRITSNGKVNIGTGNLTQTDRMLNVYGGRIRIEGISSGNSFEIMNSASAGQSHGILCQAGTNSSDINSTFRNTSGANLFRVRGDGVVFVGSSTVQQGSTSKLEVMGTLNNSYPEYSYPIMVSDDAAYNSSAGPGGGIGFSFKQNSGGAYAQAGGIRGIKENGTDGNYASALTFYTRPNGSGTVERMRIKSNGELQLNNSTLRYNNTGGSFNQVKHLEFPIYFSSGTTHTVLTIGGALDSGFVCFAVLEYIGLYSYAGQEMSGGVKRAFTRRRNNNTSWRAFNDQVSENIGENRRPTLFWDNNILKVTTPGSTQITGYIRVSAHANNMSNFTLTRN